MLRALFSQAVLFNQQMKKGKMLIAKELKNGTGQPQALARARCGQAWNGTGECLSLSPYKGWMKEGVSFRGACPFRDELPGLGRKKTHGRL